MHKTYYKNGDVGNFLNKIFSSEEAHFTLGGYVNKQNCCIWASKNLEVIEERPLHLEKIIDWCALWSEGVIGRDTAQYMLKSGRKLPQNNQCLQHFAWSSFK